jgi:hypothetical protein
MQTAAAVPGSVCAMRNVASCPTNAGNLERRRSNDSPVLRNYSMRSQAVFVRFIREHYGMIGRC